MNKLALLMLALCGTAAAQTNSCIAEKVTAQQEQYYLDPQGNPAARLVTPGTLSRGDAMTYTLAVRNICAKPATAVVIDEPVPPNVTYSKGTAKGEGTDRIFSLDGKNFAHWDDIKVPTANGGTRPADIKDIKIIRWVFKGPVDPGQTVLLHFHAIAN